MELLKWLLILGGFAAIGFAFIIETVLEDNSKGYFKIKGLRIDNEIIAISVVMIGAFTILSGVLISIHKHNETKYNIIYNVGDKPADKYYNVDHVEISNNKKEITFITADGSKVHVSNVTYYQLTELDDDIKGKIEE